MGSGPSRLRDTVTFQGDVQFSRPNDVAACLFTVPPACPRGVIRLLHPPPLHPPSLFSPPGSSLPSLPPPTPSPYLTSVRLSCPSLTPLRVAELRKFRTCRISPNLSRTVLDPSMAICTSGGHIARQALVCGRRKLASGAWLSYSTLFIWSRHFNGIALHLAMH